LGTVLLALLAMAPAGSVLAKGAGTSANVKACLDGGWTSLTTSDGTPFGSQNECVAYGAMGASYDSTARVFAIAYSNLDGVAGFNAASDVLIAKLVDTNQDNSLDAGDTVLMGRYPINFAASAFGTWGVTTHTVASVDEADSIVVRVFDSAGARFEWQGATGSGAAYVESNRKATTQFLDFFGFPCALDDELGVFLGSPSQPSVAAAGNACDGTDDTFIDAALTP